MTRARRTPPRAAARLLVVDDSADTVELIVRHLGSQGYDVLTAGGADEALALLASRTVDLVLTDIRMPGRSGFDLIHELREHHPDVEIVVITGYPTIEGAVRALHAGAWNYLSKPFTDEELFHAVREALARRANAGEGVDEPAAGAFHGLLGRSQAMRAFTAALARAAPHAGAVLLRGETGSGRESAARVLHALSGRGGTFQRVSLDASAGPAGELGATLAAAVRACAGGTLYLAALDGASPSALAAAGTALAKAELGEAGPRLVASASVAPAAAPRGGAFPPRFAALLDVPPLRERGDDVVLLARHFLAEVALAARLPVRAPGAECVRALRAWSWPGNVHELRGLATRLALAGRRDPIGLGELPAAMTGAAAGGGDAGSLADAERAHVLRVLRQSGGNKSRAAELLGIDRKTLREKLREAGGDPDGAVPPRPRPAAPRADARRRRAAAGKRNGSGPRVHSRSRRAAA